MFKGSKNVDPEEHASMPDCLVGVSALADTLERLAR